MKKKVLVLSGGGVRGTIQLEQLNRIEKKAGKRICDEFDLIVGTSVGAITGGILATGKLSMPSYAKLFLNIIRQIFKRAPIWKFWRRFSLPKYKRDVFFHYMDKKIGKNITMNKCKTKFICTSVNLVDNRTHYFKSWEKKDGKLKLKDIIARSFAAPYYFGMIIDNKKRALWVDGGMGLSNCPVDIAYIETLRQGWTEVEFTVIGTGYSDYSFTFDSGRRKKTLNLILKYISPEKGGLARVQSTHNKILRLQEIDKLQKNITLNYYDVHINKKYNKMDAVKYVSTYLSYGHKVSKINLKK